MSLDYIEEEVRIPSEEAGFTRKHGILLVGLVILLIVSAAALLVQP